MKQSSPNYGAFAHACFDGGEAEQAEKYTLAIWHFRQAIGHLKGRHKKVELIVKRRIKDLENKLKSQT